MVVGLEAVLADGTVVRTGGAPAAAAGPDLTQLIVGSEGTLAVITRVWLRAHPIPVHERRAAYAFGSFADGVEACRRILQSGATPAVLRLYDAVESQRGQGGDGSQCMLLVLDEGHVELVDATMSIVEHCSLDARADLMDEALVDAWMAHRNDTSALQGLTRKGFVVDTMEIAAPWSRLDGLFDDVRSALMAVPHARAATCHLSHSYADGACLYFTFAATPPPEEVESTYVALWDAGQRAVLASGGNLSHHHGVGLNRARFMAEALGTAHGVLRAVKSALDPNGIMNPGKLGTPHTVRRRVMAVNPTSDGRWDLQAVRAGIGVCLLLAIPLTLIAAFLDSDSTGLNAFFFFGAMFGFVLGGGCAAWVQRCGTPLSHGVVTTIVAYLGAQSVFIAIRLLRGENVNWFGVFFTLSLVILAGVAGGILGSQLQARGFVPSSQRTNQRTNQRRHQ
jgi:hypothetical protein